MTSLYRTAQGTYKSREQIDLDASKSALDQARAEAERMNQAMQAEAQHQLALIEIFQKTVINGRVLANNEANEAAILRLYQGEIDGSPFNADWFIGRLKADANLVKSFVWERPLNQTEVKFQERSRREIFKTIAREQGLSESDANWSIFPKDLLDNVHVAHEAVTSGRVQGLSPATPQELADRQAAAVEKRNQYLKTADVGTLKKIVADEAQANRQASIQAQLDHDLKQRTEMQQRQEPLPSEYRGQPVNRAFFRSCSPDVLKFFIKRYGSAAIDRVLRGAA